VRVLAARALRERRSPLPFGPEGRVVGAGLQDQRTFASATYPKGFPMNNRRFVSAFLIATCLAATSCASSSRQLRLSASPDIPAAQATAKVSATENGNTQIDLVVEHMASPERVDPGATVYVVWVRGNEAGAQPQNLGALKVDDKLKGSISAVTPLRSFDLYVTAEPSQLSSMPTGKTLLNTTVAMK